MIIQNKITRKKNFRLNSYQYRWWEKEKLLVWEYDQDIFYLCTTFTDLSNFPNYLFMIFIHFISYQISYLQHLADPWLEYELYRIAIPFTNLLVMWDALED